MKGGVKRSSIGTNLDAALSPLQRQQKARDERNDAAIQQAIDESVKSGPSIDMLTSDTQQYTTTYDRLAEKKAYASGDKPSIIPLAVKVGPQYPGGFHWVLSDADYDAIMAGAYCGFCLTRHSEMWAPACHCCGFDRELL